MFLSGEIGAELVQGQDLLVNNGFVYMRTTKGLQRVDIIYRRVDDDFVDPPVFRRDSLLGVPGLIDAYKQGNVTLVGSVCLWCTGIGGGSVHLRLGRNFCL